MSSKKKENDLRKAALDGDLTTVHTLISSGTNLEGAAPKVRRRARALTEEHSVCT